MPYYPKTKIQTDLFTNGGLAKFSDLSPYIGPYYKLSTGEKYVGKNPQALEYPELLVDLQEYSKSQPNTIATDLALTFSNLSELGTYTQNLKTQYASRKLPIPYYPTPTSQNYQVGYFSRYFAKQVNDTKFIEIDQPTFEKLAQHNSEYLWELYNVTSIPWQISENIENIYRTNRNLVRLEEKNGFRGLSLFLKENYIKFYQGADKNKDLSSLSRDNHNDLSSHRFGDVK